MNFAGTKNFKISELEAPSTARKYKIDNRIPSEYLSNAKRLLEFLQDLRDKWGSGIIITSGFRGIMLNKLVGGSPTSAHCTCNAVDIYPCNGKFEEFKRFMIEYLKGKLWDQCILEQSRTSQWIHLGLYNNSGKQRRQIFSLEQ